MSKIEKVYAREILDSRGNPTIQAEIHTNTGIIGCASVPSGASTGSHEAFEMRDKDLNRYNGQGVKKAVQNVIGPLNRLLKGRTVFDQTSIDLAMIQEDHTKNKTSLGANAILSVSLALARAAAKERKEPLYRYIGGSHVHCLPKPMMNVINGGLHADNSLDFQEFMICPTGAPTFSEAIRWGVETFHALKMLLQRGGYATSVGDEGGFAPNLRSDEEALALIVEAIDAAGYRPGKDISLALDCAASEFYEKGMYIEKKRAKAGQDYQKRSTQEQIAYLETLCAKYPIESIEDALYENDWAGWKKCTQQMGGKVQIVGDDLFVTNLQFLQKGVDEKVANAILIKMNQIGTLTETLETVDYAKGHNYKTIVSHRSGETEDPFIADLSVAILANYIKTGAPSRSERMAKYNRLLVIEEELGSVAKY